MCVCESVCVLNVYVALTEPFASSLTLLAADGKNEETLTHAVVVGERGGEFEEVKFICECLSCIK